MIDSICEFKSLQVSDDLEYTQFVFRTSAGQDIVIRLPLNHVDVLAEQSFAALASMIAMRLAKQKTVPRRPSETILPAMTATAQTQLHSDTRQKGLVLLSFRVATGAQFFFAFGDKHAAGIARKILSDLDAFRPQ